MIKTELNGSFGLDEIKNIHHKVNGLETIYEIRFVNDKRILMASKLHCFLTENRQPKISSDLKAGDKIWIQTNELYKNKTKYRNLSKDWSPEENRDFGYSNDYWK